MAVRQIDGAWYADLRWKGRRYRRRCIGRSHAEARVFELSLLRELEVTGSLPKPKTIVLPADRLGDNTFGAFANDWYATYVQTNLRPSSQRSYSTYLRKHLLPFFGALSLAEITAREIELFKTRLLASGLHPKTINGCLSILRSCLVSAVDWGRRDVVPRIRWLKVPPPPFDHLSPEESRRLLDAAQEEPWGLMIHTALRTGMRLGELLALRWECVDLTQRLIMVRRSLTREIGGRLTENTPKNNRYRYVPMSADLAEAFHLREQAAGYVFSDPLGRPHSQIVASRALGRALRAAGLRHMGWHSLRHTFATQLTSEGAPLHAVQAFLGHGTQQMTLRYAHFAPSSFRDTVEWLARAERRTLSGTVGSTVGSDPSLSSATS